MSLLKKQALMLFLLFGASVSAQGNMLCERDIQVNPLTKAVIHMTPFRGVNLVFPFEVSLSNARFNMSSNRVFKYNPSQSKGNIVHVAFAAFETEKEGEVTDFSISMEDYIFSLRLVPTLDEKKHCSDILFSLNEEDQMAHQKKEEKAYLALHKKEYAQKLAELDHEADNRVLSIITDILQVKPKKINIKESGLLEISKRDAIEAYVNRIKRYGKYNLLEFIVYNETAEKLRLKSLTLFDENQKKEIEGIVDMNGQIESDSQKEMIFASKNTIPKTGVTMFFKTTQGSFEVNW